MSSSLDPPDPAADPPYKPIPEEKLSLLVKRNDLKAASYHGLRKVSILAMRNPFFKRRRVYVESAVNSTQDRIFYVPFSYIKDRFTLSPTQYVTIDAANASNLVRQNHRFEVSFMGMSVKPHDGLQSNNNELLMYSLSMDTRPAAPVPEAADNTTVRKVRNSSAGDTVMVEDAAGRSELVSLQSLPVTSHPAPTQFAESVDLPFIHYDPVIDGHDSGTEPDQFVPIPSSRRIYKQFKEPIPDSSCIQSVNVRFTVMEIDKISDVQARSIAGVDRLGSYVSKAATGVPYLELLTKAFATASNLGKEGLKKYTRPDHVLSVDTDFLLADSLQADPGDSTDGTDEAGSASEPKVGNYLRYGYYYFISEPLDAKLYAQASASSQHMPLYMKRTALEKKRLYANEQEFFPLKGFSYVVMKVSRECTENGFQNLPDQREQHKRRLDNMLQMSDCIDLLATAQQNQKSGISLSRLMNK